MEKATKLVSIIVPAYKKEDSIIADVQSIKNALDKSRWNSEIIIVVDGFLDKTYEVAKTIDDGKNIRVIGYQTNRGKGYAIRYGMARATGELVAFIDAGMEINPNGISMVLEHMEWYNADIVVGSKRHPVSKVKYTNLRRIYSLCYQLLVFLLFQLRVRDTQAGLKVYRREVLEKVLPRLIVKAYAFDIELLAVSQRLGFTRIYEAPIEITLDFATSKFNVSKPMFLDPQIRGIIYDTIAVFYRMHFLKYYDDHNRRQWVYDKELDFGVNTGEMLP